MAKVLTDKQRADIDREFEARGIDIPGKQKPVQVTFKRTPDPVLKPVSREELRAMGVMGVTDPADPHEIGRELPKRVAQQAEPTGPKVPWPDDLLNKEVNRDTYELKVKANEHAASVHARMHEPIPYTEQQREPTVLAVLPPIAANPAGFARVKAAVLSAAGKFGLAIEGPANLHTGDCASAVAMLGKDDTVLVLRISDIGRTPAAILAVIQRAASNGTLLYSGDYPSELTASLSALRPVLSAFAEWGNQVTARADAVIAENARLEALNRRIEQRAVSAIVSHLRASLDIASGGLIAIDAVAMEAGALARAEMKNG